MKCPHCEKKVGLFSRALNKFEKIKSCPHCSEEFQSFVNVKIALILFVPAFIFSLFFLKPLIVSFGYSGSISTGLMAGLVILFSLRLKKLH
jgi:hypothetical protein